MSFLSPLWLALGAAAAVPVLLHLLRLRRGVRVDFPAIQYLLRAEREHRRELRLRNLALMLLRVAICAVLAMAAARPLGPVGGGGHAPTALAIVIDNSLSSGAVRSGGSAIESLRAAGESILNEAGPADRAWIVALDGLANGGDAAAAKDALRRVEPVGGAGDLAEIVERAATVARIGGLGAAAVVVLTDGQASEWTRAAQVGSMPVTIIALSDSPPKNRAVRVARANPTRWAPHGALEVAISSSDSADVRVALGDRTLARSTLGPNGTVTVRGNIERHGWTAGRVELPADELRGDDVRHFAVYAGDAPAVRVDASAGAFARGAIETLADAGRLDLGGSIMIGSAEAVTRRPVLVFAPDDPVRLGAANRALASAGIPWRFESMVREESSVHGGDLDGVTVRVRYALTATGASVADTIAMAGGAPWVVAGEGYVLVGSAANPAATSLPVSAQFVPWMESAISRYLLTDGGPIVNAVPFAKVSMPLGVDELAATGEQSIAVHARTIDAPARSGVYWMRRAGAVAGALVVNAEPTESDLVSLAPAALAARISGTAARVIAPGDNAARAAFATSARRPFGGILLVIVALLLIVESFVAREPRASAGSPG